MDELTRFQGCHTHALTNAEYRYEGEAVPSGEAMRWRARVWRDGQEQHFDGEVVPQAPAGAPLPAVLAALHRRIDAIG
ncbi:MAG: hypothetical protein QM702_00300 [Rubrivivax sp.]